MELTDLTKRASEVRRRYAEFERATYGRAWTEEEIVLGFVGDVGDLAKLAMAQAGMRAIPDARQKLAHELADCLWSVLVLAETYGIDIESAFLQTMDDLDQRLRSLKRADPQAKRPGRNSCPTN